MPLDIRRQMLTEKFKLSISRFSDHPLLSQISNCWQFEYMKEKKCNKPFGFRTTETLSNEIEHQTPTAFPPWKLIIPSISFELKEYFNKTDSPHYMLQCSEELIRTKWHTELHIYTDGSLIPQKDIASAAIWVPAFSYKQFKRLAHATSSMKPELAAIILALTWIDQLDLYTGAVIFSDSLSGLMAIKNAKDDNFINEILTLITHLKLKNIIVSFEWVPAHCGLKHNETVDYYAKLGLSSQIQIFNKPTFLEEKDKIIQKANKVWQQRWQDSNYFLKLFQPLVSTKFSISLTRREEKIIHRLRIGIMGLHEDLHKLGLHENGKCNLCPEIENVEHYLISCPQYIIPRAMLLAETNISESYLIMTLLKSPLPKIQRALIRFVHRTKRFVLL